MTLQHRQQTTKGSETAVSLGGAVAAASTPGPMPVCKTIALPDIRLCYLHYRPSYSSYSITSLSNFVRRNGIENSP